MHTRLDLSHARSWHALEDQTTLPLDRDSRSAPNSKVVGLYQSLLRQQLDHFFPEAVLEIVGDRGSIRWERSAEQPNYTFQADPDSIGLGIDWFGTRYQFLPGSPTPFLESEHRLIETILRVLDARFQTLYEPSSAARLELFHYPLEDYIVTEALDAPSPERIPVAMEAMRVAALSTYEDRRVSSGALLLGTESDPAFPDRTNPENAPRYSVRLTALKSVHRLCDGLRTLFVVDRQGDLAWAVDIQRWAERVHGNRPLPMPCPRRYTSHARATLAGDHVCLVLSPAQEIKIFARGMLVFVFSNARWRLLDVPKKFQAWCQALGTNCHPEQARQLFQAALNLCEQRTGALFVVLRDAEKSLSQLVAPSDRLVEPAVEEEAEPLDPNRLPPRLAKRALHHLVSGRSLATIDESVLESVASIDGAVVTDRQGCIHAFGAILRITPESILAARAIEGARTVAALAASFHGPVLKVSQDGVLSMYLSGRRVWEL